MNSRKKWLRRKSAPPASKWRNEFVSMHQLDENLTHDVITAEIIRHPVIASDKRGYEALSVLGILQRGGISPFTREQLTSAVYLLPLKNSLDKIYGEHKNRHLDYEIGPILEEIKNWLLTYKNEPVDLHAQHEFLPDDIDEALDIDEDESEQEDIAPNGATFFSTRGYTRNACCLPPIARWPSIFNRPALNAAVNTLLIMEALSLLFVLSESHNQKNSSSQNIAVLSGAFIDTIIFSTFFAIGIGAMTALFHQPVTQRHRI